MTDYDDAAQQARQRLGLLDVLQAISLQCGPTGVAILALLALEFNHREIASILGIAPNDVSVIARQARRAAGDVV